MIDSDPQSREVLFEETEEAEETEEDKRERKLDLEQEANEQFGTIEDNKRLELEEEELAIEEANRANRLASEQDQSGQETNALYQAGQSFSGPSFFKYFIIFLMFAIPNDIIDAIEFTGILIILSWLVSLFLSVATIFVMWFADSEFQRVKGHMGKVQKYQKVLASKMTKVASRLAKFAPKNPLVKVTVGAILELIPIISILPWSSISVFLAFLDERKVFKEARESSEGLRNMPNPSFDDADMV